MWTWPALLLAPLLALAEQSIVYALSTPTCQTQREAYLHGVPIVFIAVTLLFTAMAWGEARRLRRDGLALREIHDLVEVGEHRIHVVRHEHHRDVLSPADVGDQRGN